MHELETYLLANADFSEATLLAISSMAIVKVVKRNELLLQAGEVSRYKMFVAKGLLRSYVVGAKGDEHILQFSPENTWTLDVESYDNEKPSASYIAAVEPGTVLLWHKNDFEKLRADFPELRQFSEQIISRNIYYSRQRIATALSATPEEKYTDFVMRFPNLLVRVPLHMIAGYLGMSLKTLTRIRAAQLNR